MLNKNKLIKLKCYCCGMEFYRPARAILDDQETFLNVNHRKRYGRNREIPCFLNKTESRDPQYFKLAAYTFLINNFVELKQKLRRLG